MRIMVLGHGEHGKDLFAEHLGREFTSSSRVAAEVVFEELKHKYGYSNATECYEDRRNHREEWYNIIRDYCSPDRTNLARLIFEKSDIYVGCREIEEMEAIKKAGLVDLTIWVEAGDRKGTKESFNTIKSSMCDIIVDNNGDVDSLIAKAKAIGSVINKASVSYDTTKWLDAHMPKRNKQTTLTKMNEEITELMSTPDSTEEMADVAITLLDYIMQSGHSIDKIVKDKLKTNNGFTWNAKEGIYSRKKISSLMDSRCLSLMYKLPYVNRWGIRSVNRTQSVAEHSYKVAMISMYLFHEGGLRSYFTVKNEMDMVRQALHHDIAEAVTGDIPASAKHGYQKMAEAVQMIEKDLDVDRESDNPIINTVVKIADQIEALTYFYKHNNDMDSKEVICFLSNIIMDKSQELCDMLTHVEEDGGLGATMLGAIDSALFHAGFKGGYNKVIRSSNEGRHETE